MRKVAGLRGTNLRPLREATKAMITQMRTREANEEGRRERERER